MHQRNTDGITAAAKKKRQEALRRADDAISELIKKNIAVNFNAVAQTANVSTSWLYGEPELRQRIEFLRKQNKSAPQKNKQRTSDKSKDAVIRTVKDQNKQLRNEVKALKFEREQVYGKLLAANNEISRLARQVAFLEKKQNSPTGKHEEKSAPDLENGRVDEKAALEKKISGFVGKLSPKMKALIQHLDVASTAKVILAYEQQKENVGNPGGWFFTALSEAWEPSEAKAQKTQSSTQDNYSSEFVDWYKRAIVDGFVEDIPVNMLSVVRGEPQVRIRRPNPYGAPYTSANWRDAKEEWEIMKEIE